jgi:hypothetical protein
MIFFVDILIGYDLSGNSLDRFFDVLYGVVKRWAKGGDAIPIYREYPTVLN